MEMRNENVNGLKSPEEFGFYSRQMGNFCHNCGMCSFADKNPGSSFGRLMRWHRTWCPGYREHKRIYGEKDLSK